MPAHRSSTALQIQLQALLAPLRFEAQGLRFDGGPFPSEHVPHLGLIGSALALADVIEAVDESSRRTCFLWPHAGKETRGRLDAAVGDVQHACQMLRALPVGQVGVRLGSSVDGQLVPAQKTCRAAARGEHSGSFEAVDADIVSLRHVDRADATGSNVP